jgi:hypothetical protein
LEVFFAGNISQSSIESYIGTLFSKLPDKFENKNDDISSSILSEEKETTVFKKDMGDIVGIMRGVRVDKLNKKERAAARIIIEALFDPKTGRFCKELKAKNIACEFDFHFLRRRLSNVFYFTIYIDEKDFESCKKHLENYRGPTLPALYEILGEKKRLILSSQNGFANIAEIDEKIKRDSLPFADVTLKDMIGVVEKLFNESQTRTVYIRKP